MSLRREKAQEKSRKKIIKKKKGKKEENEKLVNHKRGKDNGIRENK